MLDHLSNSELIIYCATRVSDPDTMDIFFRRLNKAIDRRILGTALKGGGQSSDIEKDHIIQDVKGGKLSPTDLDERVIEKHLYTSFLPNPHPDLIVRTSGEERLSNFLLWQSAYSEFCFLDIHWPNFKKYDLLRAIRVYQQRSRRHGT